MDQHILAEYFELPRIFKLVSNHWMKGRKPSELDIPDTYRLGSGHMKFFYDKLTYLHDRHGELFRVGTNRNLTLEVDPNARSYCLPPTYDGWWNDYEPTEEALLENRKRLADKIAIYPHYYTHEGIPFSHFK
jgi:deoxyribonuclease (pyrimidine dimer)